MPRAVELLRDRPSVPGEDRLGLYDARDLGEGFASETHPDLGQRFALAIGKAESTTNLTAQDAILGDEVFVAEKEVLVDGAGDVGDEAVPGHRSDGNLPILGSK